MADGAIGVDVGGGSERLAFAWSGRIFFMEQSQVPAIFFGVSNSTCPAEWPFEVEHIRAHAADVRPDHVIEGK